MGSVRVCRAPISPGGRPAGASERSVLLGSADLDGPLRALAPADRYVLSVAFSPDGRYLLGTMLESYSRVWRVADGGLVATLRGTFMDERAGVFLEPDRVAIGDEGELALVDLVSGRSYARLQLPGASFESVAWSPSSGLLAAGDYSGDVSLWRYRARPPAVTLRGHSVEIIAHAWAAGGRRLVSGGWDGSIRLWDLAAQREEALLQAPSQEPIWTVAFDPARARVATLGLLGTVRVQELGGERSVRRWECAAQGDARGLAWAPDGRSVATAAQGDAIRLWDPDTGALQGAIEGEGWPWSLAWSPDGRTLAVGMEGSAVRLVDPVARRLRGELLGHQGRVTGLAFTPDSATLLTSGMDGTVRVWDLATGATVRVFRAHQAWVNRVAVSPDGRLVLSSSDDKTVRLWELATGRVLQVFGGDRSAVGVSFSPDGGRIALNRGVDVQVLPLALDLTDRHPEQGRAAARRASALALDGLRLVRAPGR